MEHELEQNLLTTLLNNIFYPESSFILTNTKGLEKFTLENFPFLSHMLVALIIFKSGNTSFGVDLITFQSSITDEIKDNLESVRGDIYSKPFFILELDVELTAAVTKYLYEAFDYQTTVKVIEDENDGIPKIYREVKTSTWKPTLFIIYHNYQLNQKIDAISIFHDLFDNFTLHLDASIYLVLCQHSNTLEELGIWEIYNVKEKRIVSQTASIPLLQGQDEQPLLKKKINLNCYAKRRRYFHGETFTALIKNDHASNQDWVKAEPDENGTYIIKGGYLSYFYAEMKILMNFTEGVVIGDSPMALENGSLVGKTVDLLRSEQADFSLHKMSVNPARARAVSFLFPTHNGLIYVFFKQPSPNSVRNIVTAPFQKMLWITFITFWIVLLIALRIYLRFLLNLSSVLKSQEIMFERDMPFLEESWIWGIAAICQKSFHVEPFSGSLKLKFVVASLLSIISYTAYSASIVSSLAVSNIPIKTFLDLISSNFVFTVHEQSQPFQNLLRGIIHNYKMPQKVTTVSTEKEVSQLFTLSTLASWSTSIGDDYVHSTKKAFLSYADMFYKIADFQSYTGSFICHHISYFNVQIGNILRKGGMFIKKGSQFKEVLNYVLLRISEAGLSYRHDKKYNSGNVLQCLPDEVMTNATATDFSDIFTILLVLIIGMPLTVLICLFEFFSHRYENHHAIMNSHWQT